MFLWFSYGFDGFDIIVGAAPCLGSDGSEASPLAPGGLALGPAPLKPGKVGQKVGNVATDILGKCTL